MTQTIPPHVCWRCWHPPYGWEPSCYGYLDRWYCTRCWQACTTLR